MNKVRPCVVTIAGTDPSGGAGIQADIKGISATGCYAASIISVLVAQNTQGVQSVYAIPPAFVKEQIHAVFSDLPIAAVKVGMLHNRAIMEEVARAITHYQAQNIVLDPVMIAKDNSPLLHMADLAFLTHNLFPKATLITPNLPEAEFILKQKISSLAHMEQAAQDIAQQYHTNVLIKGGHFSGNEALDVLYLLKEKRIKWYTAKRIMTKNTHGTGCTLSAAIASYLAQEHPLIEAIHLAKSYLTQAIHAGSGLAIGVGNGPVDHFYFINITHSV